MKNRLLALLTGTGLAFVVAGGCDPNPPRRIMVGSGGTGVATSTGGAVGSGGVVSSGGTVGSGGDVGSGGTSSGSGGETSGSGGATSNGGEAAGGDASMGGSAHGGRTASGGAGGRAAGSGGSASGGTTGGGGAAGPEDIIETFEDNDGRINMIGGRQGPWHSFAESGCSNQQPSTASFMPVMGGANSTTYAAHASGSSCGKFGGIGFELNNATMTAESAMSMAYNAGVYRGISFWAKGNANLRVEFGTKSFIPTDKGGSCTSNCWNVYGSRKVQGMVPSSEWKQFTVLFSDLEREDGSKTPAFDATQLLGIAWKSEGTSFDFWLDEIQFVK
ncbi:MAG TPA: hypothetical protein VHU40_03635 [Polyangia bacterium]|nr:hypothetical protein [Polyangia bacterium]